MVLYRVLNWLYEGLFPDGVGPVEVDLNHDNPHHPEPPEVDLDDNTPQGVECGCCFDEFDIVATACCPSDHAFCLRCIRSYAERQLLQNQLDIGCFDGSGCDSLFHPSVLQRSLLPASYKRWEDLLQDREIRNARVEGLECCQFCRFKMIVEVDKVQDPLFRCLNLVDGCGKVSCRLCGKEDHSPRTCEEEEQRRANPRQAVEEAMSDALMRRCPGCGRPIIKETGCNHIVCPDPICKIHFCYLCRKDITVEQYGHFHRNEEHNPQSARGANGKCLMWDVLQLEVQHAQEVEVARARATAQAENARRTQPAIAQPVAGPSRQPVQQAAALVDPPVPQVRQPQAQPAPVRPVVDVERHADPPPRRRQAQPPLNPLPVARPPADPEIVPRPHPLVRAHVQERIVQAQPRIEAVLRRQPAQVQVQARPRIEEVPRPQAVQAQPRRQGWLQAAPRAALWEEPDSESDEDTPTEDSEDDESLPAEEEEEEEEAFREVDLIPLREDVENAYEQVRKAWTSLAKSKYNLEYRRSVIRERERDIVKANRRYDDVKAAIWGRPRGQRQGHRDHRDMHALNIEVYRMRDALRRAVRRERDSRPKVGSTNTWTKERLEAYVRETRRLEQLMGDAERSCKW